MSNMASSQQYDCSPEEQRRLLENARRRTVLREEFQKLVTNPHRHATGEGGYVFDTALQRFHSMRVSKYEHFKHTPRSAWYGIIIVVVPITLSCLLFKTQRDRQEKLYRTGQVAYKDRSFKFA